MHRFARVVSGALLLSLIGGLAGCGEKEVTARNLAPELHSILPPPAQASSVSPEWEAVLETVQSLPAPTEAIGTALATALDPQVLDPASQAPFRAAADLFAPVVDEFIALASEPFAFPPLEPGFEASGIMNNFRVVAIAGVLRARLQMADGDSTGAAESIRELWAAARQLSINRGSASYQATGIEMQTAILVGVRQLAADRPTDGPFLAALREALVPVDNVAAFAESIPFDFYEVTLPRAIGFGRAISDLHRDPNPQVNRDVFDWDVFVAKNISDPEWAYDARVVANTVAAGLARLQSDLDRPFSEVDLSFFSDVQDDARAIWTVAIGDPPPVTTPLDPLPDPLAADIRRARNAAGLQTAVFLTATYVQRVRLSYYMDTYVSAVRTQLSVLAAEAGVGSVTVEPDPMSGNALILDSERRIIRSVGFDGVDQGTVEPSPDLSAPDWVWAIS